MGISELYIVKRDGKRKAFSVEKIKRAVRKAFLSVGSYATDDDITSILSRVHVSDGMSVEEIQNQIVEEFSMYDDWMDKYAYLIEIGNGLETMDEAHKTDDNLIKGCQSRVWFHAGLKDGKLYFEADSDAIITKGIAGLLIRVFSGQTPHDIVNANLDFIDKIGLTQHLSPTRSNGLLSMIKQIKYYALAYEAK